MDEAVGRLDADIRPIDDLRSTGAYRRDVAANLLRRFWAETA
jgi:xanthine dehydrogenase iron-sulfur cluster and FAD-binding subunit A